MNDKNQAINASFQTILKYEVLENFRDDFLFAYSDSGDWAQLFAKCPGYLGTKLIVNTKNNCEFITIDYWVSEQEFTNMMSFVESEYKTLDDKCDMYTASENHIGFFRAPSP